MLKNNKGFTLVELLVVITIIAILGVVAYTSFGGATDKAKASAKMQEVNSITSALTQYKESKNFYPKPADKDNNTNVWGYDDTANAKKTNGITITTDADGKIINVSGGDGGGKVSDTAGTNQIGAKGTLSYSGDIKKWLKKDAYDHEIGDLTFDDSGTEKKLIEKGIGRFPYAVYKKGISGNDKGTEYNIAYTIKDKNGDFVTKIVGDFNEASCSGCPTSLIGPGNDVLKDGDKAPNIPYKIDF